MQRKMFDVLVSAVGLLLVVTLLVAGALLAWGYNFTNSNVRHQLAEQAIVFPTAAELALAHAGTEITPGMLPYCRSRDAGQPLTTGAEAEIYADHFIAVHLSEMAYHGIYAKVSAAALADPSTSPWRRCDPSPRSTISRTKSALMPMAAADPALADVITWARESAMLPAAQTPGVLILPGASTSANPALLSSQPRDDISPSARGILPGRMQHGAPRNYSIRQSLRHLRSSSPMYRQASLMRRR